MRRKPACRHSQIGPIHLAGGPLVRGPVARAVHQPQHFARLGQAEDERVVAPGAVVGDVHAGLARAGGSRPACRPCRWWPGRRRTRVARPRPLRRATSMASWRASRWAWREAAAEVAGGGGVGDAARAEGIEEGVVVAAEFDVLEAGAVAQRVVGDVEDVVGLVIGEMDLEQVQALVDGLGQADVGGRACGWPRCRRGRWPGRGGRRRSRWGERRGRAGRWRCPWSCRVGVGFGTCVCGTRSGRWVSLEILGRVRASGKRLLPQTPETAEDFELFGDHCEEAG